MLGPFLWGRRARVTPRGEEHECAWATGELHARRVEVEGGRIAIHDRVRGGYAALLFPLAPGAKVELDGARATVTIGGSRARFEVEGGAPWQLIPGEHAARFGRREPSTRLMAVIEGAECRTQVRVP